jgi:5-methylthioadenosine/S-adenosylhomocysteine deaminase
VSPQSADLLIEPRWLLPIAPVGGALEGYAVAVADGRITAVGPVAELRGRCSARERVVRPQHALLPGLVNAHTHACHTLLRSRPLRAARSELAALERRALGADFVRDGTRAAIAAMLRAGITCFAEESPLPEEAARAAAAAQMRALIALPVADIGSAWGEDAGAHLAKAERLWDEYRGDPRIGLYFAPRAGHSSDATLTRVRRIADELDARLALQLDAACPAATAEGIGIADSARAEVRAQPLQRLHALGLLRPGCSAIGAFACDHAALELLERTGSCLIACPQAELRLGAAPRHLPLLPSPRSALGTDSPALAGCFDTLAEARAAALLAGLTGAEALQLATLGGANALGLAGRIGSIEPGKAADLTCIDLGALGAHCSGEIADAVVFAATRDAVSDVWTGGRAAVRGGRLLSFDEAELAALPAQWAQRLALGDAA